MTTPTIPTVATDANSLYASLAADLDINIDLPPLVVDTDFEMPAETGPAFDPVAGINLADLTTQVVGGSGVFDALMSAMNAHLTVQYEKNRITGNDYAQVYLGAVQAVMQFGTQFLLGKDRAKWESLNAQAAYRLTQASIIRATADIQIARLTIQQLQFANADMQLKAYTSRNQYALSKMELVTGYEDILSKDASIKLVLEQYEVARAQTRDTLSDGSTIGGITGTEKMLKEAQVEAAKEDVDATRAQTKDTLLSGQPISGLLAIDKSLKEANLVQVEKQTQLVTEQWEIARAQTKDTLSDGTAIHGIIATEKMLKEAQAETAKEELDTARAQTKDTLLNGDIVAGVISIDKSLKEAALVKTEAETDLVKEQWEIARAQTKDNLSTGGAIAGILALEKLIKESQLNTAAEQYEIARSQIRDTTSIGGAFLGMYAVEKQLKLAQKALTDEQVETARAATWDTHTNGLPITGIMAKEKALKDAQSKLVLEQFESQRGQTRGTLSTGETVLGVLGAQTRLYDQQIVSYKRDSESKAIKLLLDTWTARKTIDEGVEVPVQIDTSALDTSIAVYRTNLDLGS